MDLGDVRRWCSFISCLRMPHAYSIGFRSGDILGHSITFTFNLLRQWLSWRCVRGCCHDENNCCVFQFLKGGIMFCFRMPQHMLQSMIPCALQLPSAGSIEAAPNHDATTTRLDCRQGTIIMVLFRPLPHMPDII